jgi:hypothetical protein
LAATPRRIHDLLAAIQPTSAMLMIRITGADMEKIFSKGGYFCRCVFKQGDVISNHGPRRARI